MVIELLNEDDDVESAFLRRALNFEGTIIASDSIPLVPTSAAFDPLQWPLSDGAVTHPRSAGCFSRVLRLWREQGRPLSDAIRRCSLLPAKVLEASCASLRAKGRIRPGADADLVVFDPVRVTDQATHAHTTRPSSGIRHVLVDGVFVVRDGVLVEEARTGQANNLQHAVADSTFALMFCEGSRVRHAVSWWPTAELRDLIDQNAIASSFRVPRFGRYVSSRAECGPDRPGCS